MGSIVVHGAGWMVVAVPQVVPVQVALQPVWTAEHEVTQLSPIHEVAHALAVCVPHSDEDEVGAEVGGSVIVAVGGVLGTPGGLGVGIPSGPISIGGRPGGK